MPDFVTVYECIDVLTVDEHLTTDPNERYPARPNLGAPEPFCAADLVHHLFDAVQPLPSGALTFLLHVPSPEGDREGQLNRGGRSSTVNWF